MYLTHNAQGKSAWIYFHGGGGGLLCKILEVVWAIAAAARRGDGITENLALKCSSASQIESKPSRSAS